MIFKITPGLNLAVKIAAMLELLVVLVDIATSIGNVQGVNSESYISIAGEILSIFLILYIISVLTFFGERKSISIAYLVYMITELVYMLFVWTIGKLQLSPDSMVMLFSVLGVLILLAVIFIFIMSFFVRSQVVFKYLLVYSGSLMTSIILTFAITTLLPLIFPGSILAMRKAIVISSAVTILAPLSIILLATNVNRFIRNQQPLNAELQD